MYSAKCHLSLYRFSSVSWSHSRHGVRKYSQSWKKTNILDVWHTFSVWHFKLYIKLLFPMGDFLFDQNNYMQCSTVFTNLKHPLFSQITMLEFISVLKSDQTESGRCWWGGLFSLYRVWLLWMLPLMVIPTYGYQTRQCHVHCSLAEGETD